METDPGHDFIHGTTFFENLPTPCFYLNVDYTISQANAAARDILSIARPYGTSIFATNFCSQCVPGCETLQDTLESLLFDAGESSKSSKSNGHTNRTAISEEELYTSRTRSGVDFTQQTYKRRRSSLTQTRTIYTSHSSPFQWQGSLVVISGVTYLTLVGMQKPSWRDCQMPEEQKAKFLQEMAEPTFDNVSYYVSVMAAGSNMQTVNEAGRHKMSSFLQNVKGNEYPGVYNETFTESLALTDSVAPLSIRRGKGEVSFIRGLEDAITGARTIHDASTTVLKDPWSQDLLGVLVQVRDGLEYGDYLQRIDLLAQRDESTASGALPAMVRTMLANGELDYFSNSWETFTSSSRKELLRSWLRWFHPEDLHIVREKTSASMSSGIAVEYQVRLRRGEGWHHFEERLVPIREQDRIVRWYVITKDIQDLVRERETALGQTERLYRVINNMNLVIFEVDETWNVTQAEGALQVVTSEGHAMKASDYPGSSLHDICSVIRPGGIQELMDELVSVMDGKHTKCVVDYKLGQQYLRTIAVSGVNRFCESGKKLFGITLDISAERESEMAKVQVQTMRETARLKSQFLANISHELRTPISGLVGLLDLLSDTPLNAEQQEHIVTLDSLARTLLVIVNDVLDLSKAEAGSLSVDEVAFDFVDVLNDVCKSNEVVTRRKGVNLIYHAPELNETLMGDPVRIRQILQNLLGNAVKFTTTGSINVKTEFAHTADSMVLTTSITDTGIGIDAAAMQLLFQPFVQADQSTTREFGGTGLGLSIARNLARMMNGDIVLDSQANQGTTAIFSIELPLAPVELKLERVSSTASSVLARRSLETNYRLRRENSSSKYVLVAEDNKVNQKIVLYHLKKLGMDNIVLVENGAEAVAYIERAIQSNGQEHAIPDLVFMDCQMPILDGYDATRRLRNDLQYRQPIIALTASAIRGDREKCMAAGMNDHLAKPVEPEDLDKALKRWLPIP